MYNGVLNVYKEKGFTSHDVVAKLRGILHQKKIGHTGTLDPDAAGVLLVCLGNATKLCDMLTDKSKTYRTVMKLGIVTDTQDISGKVTESFSGRLPGEKEIKDAIYSFVGEYEQLPPMYSAIKVNGQKLYELARQGKEVERHTRTVTIHSIDIDNMDAKNGEVTITIDCSKGTYIRTLCHDIGRKLGCGACMKELTRIKVSDFLIDDALTLSYIEEIFAQGKIDEKIISVERMFKHLPSISTKESTDRKSVV